MRIELGKIICVFILALLLTGCSKKETKQKNDESTDDYLMDLIEDDKGEAIFVKHYNYDEYIELSSVVADTTQISFYLKDKNKFGDECDFAIEHYEIRLDEEGKSYGIYEDILPTLISKEGEKYVKNWTELDNLSKGTYRFCCYITADIKNSNYLEELHDGKGYVAMEFTID